MYNKVGPDYQKHSAVVTAVIAYGVANRDHLLSRKGYYITETKEEEKEDIKGLKKKFNLVFRFSSKTQDFSHRQDCCYLRF
jgi:hypothetical protein